MKRLIESCGDLEPTPTVLKWSSVSNQILNGIVKEKPIELICYNTENDIEPIYKIIPLVTNSKHAIRYCRILKAELAYPQFLGEFQKWSGN